MPALSPEISANRAPGTTKSGIRDEKQGLLSSRFARSANNFALSRRPQRGEEEDEKEGEEE